MRRALLLGLSLVWIAAHSPARCESFAWDDSTCSMGGTWTNPACWSGGGYPNAIDHSASVKLDEEGAVVIPTSSIANITINSLQLTENVALNVGDNMYLVLAQSSTGTNPTLQVDNVLTVNSPTSGSSGLRAATPLDPEADSKLTIFGSGEIRLGSNGALESSPRAKIEVNGGVEVVSSALATKPARINAELRNNGGEIRVLGGPLILIGDVENVGGAFLEIFDQFSTGQSELRLQGTLRGGKLYPGLGVVRINGGELANIEVQPGAIEVNGSIGYFNGQVTLSGGTEVAVLPTRTLEVGGTGQSGAPLLHNDGVIRVGDPLGGAATLRSDGSLVELEGKGRIVLQNVGSSLTALGGGLFRNGPFHTIEGSGFVQCPILNEGLLVVDGGQMVLFSSVTGPTGDTVILGEGATSARLVVSAGFSTHDLRVSEHGELFVNPSRSVVVHGDYVVETQNEGAISWGASTSLSFAGGGLGQAFETTSEDLGAVNAGFTGNFAIGRVAIGIAGTSVFLRDLRDNGNRGSGAEAVYATTLEVQPGAILNLNGYCFYTKLNGVPYRVQAGDGALFGGGTIVDDPPALTTNPDTPDRNLSGLRAAPNPFNPRTTIRFRLASAGHGRVTIHDLRGRRVRTLARGSWHAGEHELVWDGQDDAGRHLASGVYAVQVDLDGEVQTQRVTLLK